MSSQQQFWALSVVLHSRLRSVLSSASLALYTAGASLTRPPAAGHSPLEPVAEGWPHAAPGSAGPKPASYAAVLGAAYVLTPLLAVAAAATFSLASRGSAVAVVGLLLLIPPSVHVAHGATERALRAFGWLLAYTALGAAGGAAIGYTLGRASCNPALNDECGFTALAWVLLGAALGGLLGYCAHALRDVANHSSLPLQR